MGKKHILNSKIFSSDSIFSKACRRIIFFLLGNKLKCRFSSNSLIVKCRFAVQKSHKNDLEVIIGKGGLLKKLLITSNGKGNSVLIKDGFYSKEGLIIIINGHNNKVIIGEDASFYQGISSISIIGNNCSIAFGDSFCCKEASFSCRDNGSKLIIGNNADIASNVSFISMEGRGIYVGDDLFCSYNVEIRNTDSHSILDADCNRINPAKDVHIKNKVWIAQGSLILKGSNVPTGTIIAAKSLVNKCFDEDCCLIAGSPACIKKVNIHWEKERL